MSDPRHMDPTINASHRRAIVEGRLRLVNDFCSACNRDTMIRLEEPFLEALNDWVTYMRHTAYSGRQLLQQVEKVIERARDLTDRRMETLVVVFHTKSEKREAMRRCRSLRHQVRIRVDRRTLETFHFCVKCNAELRLSEKARRVD